MDEFDDFEDEERVDVSIGSKHDVVGIGSVTVAKVTEKDTYGQSAEFIVSTADGKAYKVSYDLLVNGEAVSDDGGKCVGRIKRK